ncbi:hypothetical protein PHJA_002021700 [Phtheirospermum japonicum]|uniref:IRK-interacting protein n=1 Tax=Phtheirospermum japonicum TaxID=374723 RepID=A0A830CN39_9LAMI|nr:hypothetical protein PHJA_002021700 [Phtheirospermum japonicum]
MAAIYREQSGNGNEISRQDVEAAIAKAVELRALHAALMQGNSPAAAANFSPVSRHAPNLPAQDYPVFTPSYDDEPIIEYQQTLSENRSQNYADNWADYAFDIGNTDDAVLSEYRTANVSSRKGDDQNSVSGLALRAISPGPDYSKSRRRNSLGDIKSVSSRNKCKPSIISNDFDSLAKNSKKSNIIVPLTDSHSSLHPQPRNKGLSLSWLLPKALKKKYKNENSPVRRDEISQVTLNDFGMLKSDLIEAREARDNALTEVAEMKSSVVELSRKLEYLETYCEELKKALRQVNNFPKKGKLINDVNEDNSMPVTEEVMVEGFLQIVSEARLSVKQFCKTLVKQIEENDHILLDNLNSLLQPYKLSLNSKYSKAVLYHLEAFINQSLYQDFENCVFQKNGTPKLLDPRQERQAQFQLFASLRNLSWNEVLRKGTKYYSDEFSKFCDQKMSGIIATLGWTRPWPEQLLQAFFVAAKCIWLLHLLAFSFDPPLGILRVEENRPFEARYMEDMLADKQRPHGPSRVKIMAMPGFYVHDEVIKCKVLCRYRSIV